MQRNNIIQLLIYVFLAAVFVFCILNLIFGVFVHFFDYTQSIFWHVLTIPTLLLVVALVVGASLFKYIIYRRSGKHIAQSLHARQLQYINGVPEEISALNINAELAQQCRVTPAYLYVLNDDLGINALTVGYGQQDVSIILTWGALQSMNLDELKGMLAYEYTHILSKRYIEHTRLEVFLFGFIIVGQIGSYLIVRGMRRKVFKVDSIFAVFYVSLGGFVWLLGSLGILVSRFLKYLIFYKRTYQTDVNACELVDQQYLLHALTRIYVHKLGSHIYRMESESLAHYCFANALSEQSWFKVHPPLSRRIYRLHPTFSRKAVVGIGASGFDWQNFISKILLPTNEEILLDTLDAESWIAPPQPLPVLRLSPISFSAKDAVMAISPEIRQSMERPVLLSRAMQTATGCREVIVAIFMIRQYRQGIPKDAQVSQAIIDTLLKLDGRIYICIFNEALSHIDNMPTIISRQFIAKLAQLIQLDGEIGLFDCLLLERVKATQGFLEDALPIAKKDCTQAIVHLVDALLHVQYAQNQLSIRRKILKKLITHSELEQFSEVTHTPLDLAHSLRLLSGLLFRERLYLLDIIEHEIWSERMITQDELDVLELLYWRLGFQTEGLVNRMLKQNSLLIL